MIASLFHSAVRRIVYETLAIYIIFGGDFWSHILY
nr:MAG TPA: hypothetical protein [Microviridae sp.]